MIHHRTWLEWLCLRWIAQVAIHYSNENVEIKNKDVGRFFIIAIFRLWLFESKMRRMYPHATIHGWLNWKN